jgi:hypothetical protein
MRTKNSHIVFLAWLMLALFISPLSIKAAHHHLPPHSYAMPHTEGKSISAALNSCPVCNFEFVTFLSVETQFCAHLSRLTPVYSCLTFPGVKTDIFACCTLRAPPVC